MPELATFRSSSSPITPGAGGAVPSSLESEADDHTVSARDGGAPRGFWDRVLLGALADEDEEAPWVSEGR